MKLFWQVIILTFLLFTVSSVYLFPRGPIKKPINAADIIAAWSLPITDGPYPRSCQGVDQAEICFPYDEEEMDFSTSTEGNVYNSYIHSRPEDIDCTWSLKGSNIDIKCSELEWQMDIISISSDMLVVSDSGDIAAWEKI